VDQVGLKRLLEKRRVTTIKLLTDADFEDVEPILLLLKRFRPHEELSIALMERMAIAPFPEFNALKALYVKHFVKPLDPLSPPPLSAAHR
jgi:hypothetical protein